MSDPYVEWLSQRERAERERDAARAEVKRLRAGLSDSRHWAKDTVARLAEVEQERDFALAEVERLSALLNPDDEALVSAILNRLNWHKTDALKHDIRTILGALRREAALGGERDE